MRRSSSEIGRDKVNFLLQIYLTNIKMLLYIINTELKIVYDGILTFCWKQIVKVAVLSTDISRTTV